jgi:hypothetical protein
MKDVRAEVELQRSPFHLAERDVIRDLVVLLRAARDPGTFRALYVKLFARAVAAQTMADELRADHGAARQEIQRASAAGATVAELAEISQRLKRIDAAARAVGAAQGIYRSFGDATVWRALRHDRAMISVLGGGPPVARFAAGKGFEAEQAQIEDLWQRGTFAIHNDLTNCLRNGDVTAFEFEHDKTHISLYEVKSGRKVNTHSRQAIRLQRLMGLVNDGYHSSGRPDGAPLQMGTVPIDYGTLMPQLIDLVRAARSKTYAGAALAPEIAVGVIDNANPAGLSQAELDAKSTKTGWDESSARPEDIHLYSASARRIRDRQADHVFPALAPLPLLPLPVKDLTDLLSGRLDFVTKLNVPRLRRRFDDRGLSASIASGRLAERTFLTATRGRASVTLPAYVHEQLTVELMNPKVLVDVVDWIVKQAEEGRTTTSTALGYRNETAVWDLAEGVATRA